MDYKYSNIWQRFADFYLSSFFHLLFSLVVVLLQIQFGCLNFNFFSPEFWINCILVFLTYHLIETIIEGLSGAGLAKQILGMRLVDATYKKPIGIFRSLLRTVFSVFSFLIFGMGFFAIGFNREHKSLHDLLTGSIVINLPKQGFLKFSSIFWTCVALVPGFIISLALLATLSTLPLGMTKSLINLSKTSSFQLDNFISNPELTITLPYQQKRLNALTELNTLEYVEFHVDPLSRYNYIQPEVLQLLGVKITDYDYLLTDWQDDITQAKLKSAIIIPKLTFKDIANKDLVIMNQKFLIHPSKTLLGTDFLDMFDYQINNQTMLVSLYDEDQELLKEPSLDMDSKNYLLNVLRKIRFDWRLHQANFSALELEEFAKLDDKLSTAIELDFDPQDGYIKSAVILEPTDNEVFNKSCENFLKDLPQFSNVPATLKSKGIQKFKMNLTYREILRAPLDPNNNH
jgi:uncharacterized RDD family membrane protein YckC